MPIAEVARTWYLRPQDLPNDVAAGGLEVTAGYKPLRDSGTFSYAAHAAVVSVDTELGDVRILDYAICEDGGTLVNPMIVDGQVIGGTAQGIGTALYEQMPYDAAGQPLGSTLADYILPGATEVPEPRILHMQTPSPLSMSWPEGHRRGRRDRSACRDRQCGERRAGTARRGDHRAADHATTDPCGFAGAFRMKAAAFEHARPASVADAISLLAGEAGARVLAGGQSLGPMLNLRLAQPRLLVQVNRLPELTGVAADADAVTIGACVTHAAIADGLVPDIGGGVLARVADDIAYRAVRNRGTIGGSLCHADPAADWVTVLMALDATMLLQGPDGARSLRASDFIQGAFRTALAARRDHAGGPRASASCRCALGVREGVPQARRLRSCHGCRAAERRQATRGDRRAGRQAVAAGRRRRIDRRRDARIAGDAADWTRSSVTCSLLVLSRALAEAQA